MRALNGLGWMAISAGPVTRAGTVTRWRLRICLERLCRCGLRAPFSQERLSLDDEGQVVYELPRPWPTASGITQLVMAPTELLRRLAALCPSPGTHLIRYPCVMRTVPGSGRGCRHRPPPMRPSRYVSGALDPHKHRGPAPAVVAAGGSPGLSSSPGSSSWMCSGARAAAEEKGRAPP